MYIYICIYICINLYPCQSISGELCGSWRMDIHLVPRLLTIPGRIGMTHAIHELSEIVKMLHVSEYNVKPCQTQCFAVELTHLSEFMTSNNTKCHIEMICTPFTINLTLS